MNKSDSSNPLAIILVTILGLGGCVSQQQAVAVTAISSKLSEQINTENELIQAFQNVCLSNSADITQWTERASSLGWQTAEDQSLKAKGLEGLRKLVLSVPGGGARFSEEQRILTSPNDATDITLNLERRFFHEKTLSTRCEVYGRLPFLKTCETLGRGIGKQPDHNQRYEDSNAQFIRWNATVAAYPATVSCETAPHSPTFAYQGISLKLQINQVEAAKPQPVAPAAISATQK